MITHLACIMDGNRRWAKQHSLLPWRGHKEGIKTILRVVDFCLEQKISYLSLYAFSLENVRRPEGEKRPMFDFMVRESEQMGAQMQERDVRVTFIGNWDQFPPDVRAACTAMQERTGHMSSLHVQFMFFYGARQELVDCVRRITAAVIQGELDSGSITQDTIRSYLWTASIPDPDLIVRTGGHRRLSNFLLYQSAYSELYFLDCLWPDMSTADLQEVVDHFNHSKRNFGL